MNIFSYITKNSLFGIIPLDILAHGIVGYIIIVFLLKKKVKFIKAYLVVLFIAVLKESIDASFFPVPVEETVKDIVVTMIFPSVLSLVRLAIRKETY